VDVWHVMLDAPDLPHAALAVLRLTGAPAG